MSQFLPDGPYQTQPPSGVAEIAPPDPETTSTDIALMQRVFSAAVRNVNLIPSDFIAYIIDVIQTSRLQIPIGQVFGFEQFEVQTSSGTSSFSGVLAPGASASGSGPALTGLPPGKYMVAVAFTNTSSSAFTVSVSVTIGGTTITAEATGGGNPSSGASSVTQIGFVTQASAADVTSSWSVPANGFGTNQNYGLSNIMVAALKYANQ